MKYLILLLFLTGCGHTHVIPDPSALKPEPWEDSQWSSKTFEYREQATAFLTTLESWQARQAKVSWGYKSTEAEVDEADAEIERMQKKQRLADEAEEKKCLASGKPRWQCTSMSIGRVITARYPDYPSVWVVFYPTYR